MMKIQLLLILSAAFKMANPLPIRFSPTCRKLYMKGFPFYGKESVTLSEMLKNHEKTGLGEDHLAQQKIIFQQQDKDENGLLEVEEKLYDEYSKMKKGENINDFELSDKDKNGLISMSEMKNYYVALGLFDPSISEFTLRMIYGAWTGTDGQLDDEEYKEATKFASNFCIV